MLSPILYRRTWLVDGTEPGFKGALRWRAPAEILYSFSSRKIPLPRIRQMLERHTCVVIEVDSLVRLPMRTAGDRECFKGVVVQRLNEVSLEVSELFAEWEWTNPLAVGTNMPYTYDIEPNGVLHRRQSEQDCPCGKDNFHEMHLALVETIEETAARHAVRIDASGIHYVVPWSEG